MGLVDIALVLPVIGVASAAAIELRPAILALLLAIHIGKRKHVFPFHVVAAVQHIAHLPFVLTDKLMAWEDIPFGRHSNILIAAAAPAKPFDCTGALV